MIDPYMEDWKHLILSMVSEEEVWTARLCRQINEIPETKAGISFCGKCFDYANPRKRARHKRLPMLLPGFEDGCKLLHIPCAKMRFRKLQYILHWLEKEYLIYSERERIPDPCTPRGWDTATVWRSFD